MPAAFRGRVKPLGLDENRDSSEQNLVGLHRHREVLFRAIRGWDTSRRSSGPVQVPEKQPGAAWAIAVRAYVFEAGKTLECVPRSGILLGIPLIQIYPADHQFRGGFDKTDSLQRAYVCLQLRSLIIILSLSPLINEYKSLSVTIKQDDTPIEQQLTGIYY